MKTTLPLMFILLCAGVAAAQDRLADTLRKGILEEESKHNLAAAVTDYQQVVAAFDEDRKTAATALFRLAECQRGLHHDDQAKAAYQRIVRDFADQGRVVDQSRTILAATYKIAPGQAPPAYFTPRVPDPKVEEAKQRYRASLMESIQLSKANQARMAQQIALGVVGPEALEAAKEHTLQLERDMAAFDIMGIIPAK
jgi:hypothetical protein